MNAITETLSCDTLNALISDAIDRAIATLDTDRKYTIATNASVSAAYDNEDGDGWMAYGKSVVSQPLSEYLYTLCTGTGSDNWLPDGIDEKGEDEAAAQIFDNLIASLSLANDEDADEIAVSDATL